jgi:ATP synthase mitochondrial F1 complex assembly factor 1
MIVRRVLRSMSSAASGSDRVALDTILDVQKMRAESAETIRKLWLQYHVAKHNCLSAVIDAPTYEKLSSRGAESPRFVLPLPRTEGFETYYLEARERSLLVAKLDAVQRLGAEADPALTVHYFDEFRDDKQLVLMRGFVDLQAMPLQDAQYLLNLYQICLLDESKHALVRCFNHTPDLFDLNALVEQLERLPQRFEQHLIDSQAQQRGK